MDEIFLLFIKVGFRFCILIIVFPFVALIATPYIILASIPAKEDSSFLTTNQSDAAETYLGRIIQKYSKRLDYLLSGWDPGI